ncbi:hypothetical protein Slin15195_G105760 [Septoria linicola]|uniref:Uncharacterized protein n=1 Tax=Septoria linicola TaxID=215465 RepID=A0A9Q9EP33_9PEZI|nr:hypothetical protein Slin15195_G105760 [Septoria linicola]
MFQHHITVAEAAAILNVVIVIVQVRYPLLITLVAVGIVKSRTNVATWSVFGRLINQSYWPILLQTDTVAGNKVDERVRGIAISSSLTTLLLAIAAVVTPLGLHSTLRNTELDDVRFEYSRDTSAMGLATQSRAGYNNDDGVEVYNNDTGTGMRTVPDRDDAFITTTIPLDISNVFKSADNANDNQTKPNPDSTHVWLDHGKPRTQGRFQYYQQFFLENRTRAIEGLIISTQDTPGIGLRNHTLPPASEYGYTWKERILWLKPVTQCTSLNLTYEYMIPPPDGQYYALNQSIVNRGGFICLPELTPILDLNGTQSDPRYLNRAHAAAVLTNIFLAKYLKQNRTILKLNTRYSLGDYQDPESFTTWDASAPEPNRLYFSSFRSLDLAANTSNPSLPGPTLTSLKASNHSNIGDRVVTIDPLVKGYDRGDSADITIAGASGGLMLGIGTQIDEEGNSLPESDAAQLNPGSMWSQPLFACMSGVAASVKEVTFQLNGTNTLDNLVVQSVEQVLYASEDDFPIWAMEQTNRNISQVSPFWGMISQEAANTADVATARQASFRLPASSTSVFGGYALSSADDAVAGAKASLAAIQDIYTAGDSNKFIPGSQDYTGGNNYLLYRQWQKLLGDPTTAGRVIDLIWTDLMANYLVSARSTLSTTQDDLATRRDESSILYANRPASQFSIGISYDWRHAIPALLFVCVYVGLLAWGLIMFMTRGLSITILRFMLNQTAAGRSITTERYHATSDLDVTRTAVWARIRGDEMVRVGKDSVGMQHFGGAESQEYYPLESKPGMHHSAEHDSQ